MVNFVEDGFNSGIWVFFDCFWFGNYYFYFVDCVEVVFDFYGFC